MLRSTTCSLEARARRQLQSARGFLVEEAWLIRLNRPRCGEGCFFDPLRGDLALERKKRPCGAFLGPGVSQGESLVRPGNLANSVALEPVVLVLLAPFISAISAAAAAAVATAAAAAAAAGESRCV